MSAPIATIEGPTLTAEEEQEKWLGEAIQSVQEKAAYMHAAIKKKNFVLVLKYASQMLSEMRTGMLSPQHYYELYIKVFDQLQRLEMYFHEEVAEGRPVENMYEVVQHAGNIVPRMYLLITIGSVFIKTKRAPTRDILQDLVEMCKGVQHPTRGLFVRNYLLTMAKSKLPDLDNEYCSEELGSVTDTVNFILQNFKEMVWLWVRMETKAVVANKSKRDKERKELRILVGFNLVRLSQLDGIDKVMYQQDVLPRILAIVLSYREVIAQQYLLDIIIQVFPDEFHLLTLNDLLSALSNAVAGVDVHTVLNSLMDRLGNYVLALRDGTAEVSGKKEEKVIRNMFQVFQAKINDSVSQNTSMFTPSAFAETQFSLLKLVQKTYPGAYDRVDEVLNSLHIFFSQQPINADATKVVRKLLENIIEQSADINGVLELPSFGTVHAHLPFKARRDVAVTLATRASKAGTRIFEQANVTKLFELIAPIVKNVEDTPADRSQVYTINEEEEFEEEQNLVCRVLHVIEHDDLAYTAKLFSMVKKQLGQGGPDRMRFTLVPMTFLYTRLAIRCRKLELAEQDPGVSTAKLFQYLHNGDGKGLLEHLRVDSPLTALRTYLVCANAADTCGLPDTSYDFYCEAFVLYEENSADSKQQISTLSTMISSLCALRSMPEESYDTIATKVCQYSSKLLKKPDQCRVIALCSHMFWKKSLSEPYHKKVVECLQRSLKIVDNCGASHQLMLFVDILNRYLYYYAVHMPNITVKYIATLLECVNTQLKNIEADEGDEERAYFASTRRHIKVKQREEGSEGDHWNQVEV